MIGINTRWRETPITPEKDYKCWFDPVQMRIALHDTAEIRASPKGGDAEIGRTPKGVRLPHVLCRRVRL
jgi:hypothetical protein